MNDQRFDWRRPADKERRVRETFPDALPRLWWFHFHDRRAPTDAELAQLRAAFMKAAAVVQVTADVFRSTALQGNPYVVAFTCPPPAEVCVELALGERVCALYLAQSNALGEVELNFVSEFGEADNPFRQDPTPSPGT